MTEPGYFLNGTENSELDAAEAYQLGLMYFSGEGVPQDTGKAEAYFKHSSARGNAEAALKLAQITLAKGGDDADDRYIRYVQLAAKRGLRHAYVLLGDYFMHTERIFRAFDAYLAGADAGSKDALEALCDLLNRDKHTVASDLAKYANENIHKLIEADKKGLPGSKAVIQYLGESGFDITENDIDDTDCPQNIIFTTDLGDVLQPVKGTVIPAAEISDPYYAGEPYGPTLAVKPADGTVYAPFEGEVTALFTKKNAVILTNTEGLAVMIRIGTETDTLNGECFETVFAAEEFIMQGSELLHFDRNKINAAGLDDTVIVTILNPRRCANIRKAL